MKMPYSNWKSDSLRFAQFDKVRSSSSNRLLRFGLPLLAVLVANSSMAQATWNATATGTWSTPGNWVGSVTPTPGNTTSVTFTPSVAVVTSFSANVDDAIVGGGTTTPFDLNVLNLNGSGDSDGTNASNLENITIGGTGHALNFTGAAGAGNNQINYNVSNTTASALRYTLNSVITNTELTIVGSGGTVSGNMANPLRIVNASGPGSLTKSGTGRAELTGNISFSGALRVTDGRLNMDATGQNWDGGTEISGGIFIVSRNMSAGTGTITMSGGTLTYSNTFAPNNLVRTVANNMLIQGNIRLIDRNVQPTATLAIEGDVDLDGAVRVINANASTTSATLFNETAALNGVVSNGGIIKGGDARLSLTNANNSFTGGVTVRQGTLLVGADALENQNGALGNSATAIELGDANTATANTINLMTNGAFTVGRQINVNNNNATGNTSIGSTNTAGTSSYTNTITLNRNVNLAAHASGGNTGTVEISGQITDGAGSFGVTVGAATSGGNGLGIVNLSRANGNSYDGGTTVSSGTFLVNNTSGSATGTGNVTIQSTATLGGSGRISGGVTLENGSTVSPGNSPGALNTGTLTLNDGGNYNWQVVNATGAAGTGFDTINVTGTLELENLTGGTDFNINLWSLSSISPADVNGNATNFNSSLSQYWTLISTTGGINGTFDASEFTINLLAANGTSGFTNDLAGGTFSLSVVGNDLRLNFTAVPEPSACLLIGTGLMLLVTRRKGRRSGLV